MSLSKEQVDTPAASKVVLCQRILIIRFALEVVIPFVHYNIALGLVTWGLQERLFQFMCHLVINCC